MRNPIEMLVIGASAGGVEAVRTLLQALPATLPVAVAIVLHLPANRQSLLPQIFAGQCALPVKEVEDKEPVRPGVVYVAAPDYHMLIEPNRSFSLSCDEPVNYSRPSIDLLFESAALCYKKALMAIVLTGASSDGAAGLAAVRSQGGVAWVQEPTEAQASTMPLAAIKEAGADLVITLREMASLLSEEASWT